MNLRNTHTHKDRHVDNNTRFCYRGW